MMKQPAIVERTELCQLYLEFLSMCLKSYIYAGDLIDQEVRRFTKNELKEGWLFFLLIFSHGVSIEKIQDIETMKLYICNPAEENIELTPKGEELYAYLNKKVDLHSSILKFNGISFYDLIGDINGMSKIMKFWKVLINFANN